VTFIVGASAHGSPGVSTAMQMVASLWESSAVVPVVVEADASGGVLAARYELSLSPGFVTLAESLRKFEKPALLDHAQRLPSGVAGVALSPSATAASAQLRSAVPFLGPYLAESEHPVVLDAGTVLPDSKIVPALTAADLMLWFVRPTREELLVLRHRLAECAQPDDVVAVLVGDTPYNAEQVAAGLDIEVLHTLPVDQRGAAAVNLGGDDRFLRRSPLARSCTQLVSLITERMRARRRSAGDDAQHGGQVLDLTDRAASGEVIHVDDDLKVWVPTPEPSAPADPELVVWVNDD